LKNIKNIVKKRSNFKSTFSEFSYKDGEKLGIDNPEKWSSDRLEKWPIYIQLLSAIICLMGSSTFHLFSAYGEKVGSILNRMDYAGISILIAGSTYPPYFYLFYCNNLLKKLYLGFISVFAIIVFLVSLLPKFTRPEYRWLRGFLFLMLGISTAIPFIHLIIIRNSGNGIINDAQILFWVLGGAVYIVGCLIYIFRFPERKFPGKFDFLGSSHQIWHIFVLTGIILHHFASVGTYYDRLSHECPA
jgi:adiponectin receptor